jgi:hypothetical protein
VIKKESRPASALYHQIGFFADALSLLQIEAAA